MEERFTVKTDFTPKKRIDIIRAFMGRAYYGFILVAAAVFCFNLYLINTGRAVEGDGKKTALLFVIMLIWALIPVAVGFVWDKVSKVRSAVISVFDDRLTFSSRAKSFELESGRFCGIIEREGYIKLGPAGRTVIIDIGDVTFGDGEKLAQFLRDMSV